MEKPHFAGGYWDLLREFAMQNDGAAAGKPPVQEPDSLGHQVKDFTLDEIQAGAAKLKFPLQKKTISLQELQKLHMPAILHLNSTWPIVAVPAMDDDYAIVCYQGESSCQRKSWPRNMRARRSFRQLLRCCCK